MSTRGGLAKNTGRGPSSGVLVGFKPALHSDRVTYKQKYEQFKMVNVVVMFILSTVALCSDSV